MIIENDFNPSEVEDQYDVFQSVIITDIEELEDFFSFFEGVMNLKDEGEISITDEFLIGRDDPMSGGIEMFVGLSLENEFDETGVRNVLKDYQNEVDDGIVEIKTRSLTGGEKTVRISLAENAAELGEEFNKYFSSYS